MDVCRGHGSTANNRDDRTEDAAAVGVDDGDCSIDSWLDSIEMWGDGDIGGRRCSGWRNVLGEDAEWRWLDDLFFANNNADSLFRYT